jgi:4-amino-4-deoxy-L-arabinose transferase-like glycosyltransferase
MTSPETQPAPPTRLEWGLLAFVVLVGFTLRAWLPSRLAIEHFDEGVYASNLAFGEDEGFSYPDRHLYAPPLVPWILELTLTFFGPTVPGCFGLGILAGTATIAAVWWVTRRWFGPIAALSAATLIAFSGPHIVFSRTALTDVPMGLWFTLALGFLGESFRYGSRGYAIAAGVAVALAWWTKYNGWLPLAIGMAGMLAWLLTARPGWAITKRSLLCWGIAAAVAIILWSPVWWGLQSKGGYAAVAANHARYFHGLSGWWDAFRQQIKNLILLTHTKPSIEVIVVLLPALFLLWDRGQSPRDGDIIDRGMARLRSREQRSPYFGCLAYFACFIASAAVLPWFREGTISWGATGCLAALLAWQTRIGFPAMRHPAVLWIVLASFASMFVLTPLYRPYPRLTMPLVIWGCVASSLLVAVSAGHRTIPGSDEGSPTEGMPDSGKASWLGIVLSALLMAGWLTYKWDKPIDRSDLARATAELRSAMQDDARKATRKPDCVAYVYAEPAVFFHLSGVTAAGPVGDLEFASPTARQMPMPVYLVVGPHARRSERFAEQWTARGDRFEKVREWAYRPSLVVLLDHYHPDEVRHPENRPTETIELYRLK